MLSVVKAVEQKLQIESSEQISDTLKNEELKTAAEMFVYLITCPNALKQSIIFYENLFQTQSPDQIILTLNRLKKDPNSVHFTKIAKPLSKRMKLKLFSGTAAMNAVSQVGKSEDEYQISNHPVHIMTKDHQMSPSAFIPFCDFGGNMSAMGVKIDQFDVPVCNSFQAKLMNDQLCYEVDLNTFSNKKNFEKELEIGLNFLIDYNEDRQMTFEQNKRRKNLAWVTMLQHQININMLLFT